MTNLIKWILLSCVFFTFALSVERPKKEDFLACFEKNKASVLNYEGMQAFALSENLLAVIKSPNKKLNKYVKYDPFLNLYLVRTDFSVIPTKMTDEQNLTRSDWVGILDANNPLIGHLKYLAQNINEKDQLDFKSKIGQLNTPCCEMVGIALNNSSFIGNRYLKHFMKYNDVYWGDVGADFEMREDKIYVSAVRKSGQFLLNDEIISVDGKKFKDVRELNEKILFADRGSTLYFQLLRDNQDLNVSANVFAKDLSKFNLPNSKPVPKVTSFKSNLGLSVNSSLLVTKVESNSKAEIAGFLIGDKILRVNNQIINNFKQLQDILSRGNDFNILIQRSSRKLPVENVNESQGDGQFQFFIRLKK